MWYESVDVYWKVAVTHCCGESERIVFTSEACLVTLVLERYFY